MKARALAVVLLVLACIPARAAEEGWGDVYEKAQAAADRRDWPATRDLMQRAIALKPGEQNPAIYKKKSFVYVPHFWLGIALFQLGDIDGAAREFATSETQGVVRNTMYFAQLNGWKAKVQEEKVKRAQRDASDVRKAADTAIADATIKQGEAMMVPGGDRTDDFQKGRKFLDEAIKGYDKAGTDQAAYKKVAENAERAKAMFESAAKSARAAQQRPVTRPPVTPPRPDPAKLAEEQKQKELTDARVSVSVKLDAFDSKLNEAEEGFRNDRSLQSFVQNARSQAEQWSAMVAAATEPADVQKVGQSVAMAEEQLSQKLAMARAAKAQPAAVEMPVATSATALEEIRTELRRAWSAFSTGTFAQCESITTALISSKRGTDEAYAIRGIARYTEAMTKSDDAMLDKATSDFATALKLNPKLRFDKNRLSPKLVAYFDEIRKSRAR
jgi:hypothetical protein